MSVSWSEFVEKVRSHPDPKRLAMLVGSAVVIPIAMIFTIRQCASMTSGPVKIEQDTRTVQRVELYKSDVAALAAMDTPTLKAEIKKRDAALQAAKQGTDYAATQEAEEAWVRAMETLTQRPAK